MNTKNNPKNIQRAAYVEWGAVFGVLAFAMFLVLLTYTIGGTEERVPEIKQGAEARIQAAGFNVLRYEGYQRGSWCNHGGKVWYQVEEQKNPSIRYRVYVTKWSGELMLTYNAPENVSNLQVKVEDAKR